MNKKFCIFLASLMLAVTTLAHNKEIKVGDDGHSWDITTHSTGYRLVVSSGGDVWTSFYGNKLNLERPGGLVAPDIQIRGGHMHHSPMIEVIFPDGVREIELEYKTYEIIEINGYTTLKIVQVDKFYSLEVTSFLRVLPEYDMIEKWVELVNTGRTGIVKVENLLSGSVFLPKDVYELTHYSGNWGSEFTPQKTVLSTGTKTLEVKNFKSYGSSSFLVRPEGEDDKYSGKVWFGSINYSGNWRIDFEKSMNGTVQIVGGMNFWDQEINLNPQQKITSPSMLFGYTENGAEGVNSSLSSYVRDNLPESHRDKIRPLLYNSWYATTFDVNEEHQLALAKVAKDIGIEMFVIDDGWFKGRVNDRAGLGDWTVDMNKFPNGLKPLIDKINAIGLDFGIWIEPEMVNPNSDLYRNHPEWVFHYPNRQRIEGRNQLILNIAREDVYQYLYENFHKLLKENNIKFIKWDMNKPLTNPGFPSAPTNEQRAVRVKYVENLYRLVETLRKEFPDVWFENCSSGGGRVDLAMMSRFDFNWVSDNTDAVERIFIQDSYLSLFPANTMISWVTHEDWHQQKPSLEYKFDVSMAGVLGVGYDITQWDEEQKRIASEKIALYKKIRETIQKGDVYRIVSPYDEDRCILQYVGKNKQKSVIFAYNMAKYPNYSHDDFKRSPIVKLRGLLPDALYSVDGSKETFTGRFLMEVGISTWFDGAYKSKIIPVEVVD